VSRDDALNDVLERIENGDPTLTTEECVTLHTLCKPATSLQPSYQPHTPLTLTHLIELIDEPFTTSLLWHERSQAHLDIHCKSECRTWHSTWPPLRHAADLQSLTCDTLLHLDPALPPQHPHTHALLRSCAHIISIPTRSRSLSVLAESEGYAGMSKDDEVIQGLLSRLEAADPSLTSRE
jgi:hypothetical protein